MGSRSLWTVCVCLSAHASMPGSFNVTPLNGEICDGLCPQGQIQLVRYMTISNRCSVTRHTGQTGLNCIRQLPPRTAACAPKMSQQQSYWHPCVTQTINTLIFVALECEVSEGDAMRCACPGVHSPSPHLSAFHHHTEKNGCTCCCTAAPASCNETASRG